MDPDETWVGVAERRYVEAFPRLRIGAALKAYRSADPWAVTWRNQAADLVGSASPKVLSGDILDIAVDLFATKYFPPFSRTLSVHLVYKDAGPYRREAYAVCADSMHQVKQLVFKDGEWLCSACHGLVNRSAVVKNNIRQSEQLAKLEVRLGSGRRRGMHQATYDALLAERDGLIKALRGRRYTANEDYTDIITAEWMKDRLPKRWS